MNPAALAQFNEELVRKVRGCDLRAELRDGQLVVMGKVGSYYNKQIALHLARQWAPDIFILTTEIIVEPRG